MKQTTRRQRISRGVAERARLYSQAFEFIEALWDRDYMQSKTREEFEEIGRVAREARRFGRRIPMGKIRTLYLRALERRYCGVFWGLPATPTYVSQVEEDPIGKQFSDSYRTVDNPGTGEAT